MRAFAYIRADSIDSALRGMGSPAQPDRRNPQVQYLAGGTLLLDLMKLEVLSPHQVIDINGLESEYGRIEVTEGGLHLGALVRMSQAADDARVRRDYPVIAQSLALAASAQIRNMASLGGNLLQRTRCTYFRDTSWQGCNKRQPGSGCAALNGPNRQHAVLGVSDQCISTYPGDFAQSLVALGATVETVNPAGRRSLELEALYRDAQQPELETNLLPGELITGIRVPAGPWTRNSAYLKIRDRVSYEFALASAAVALDLSEGRVREARIALGGVSHRPWRAREAESVLKGQPLTQANATAAARAAFATARPRAQNAFKVELGQRTLVRALLQVAGQTS
jgi:xanthine dehydrogenase YagS FAD-binding subunit